MLCAMMRYYQSFKRWRNSVTRASLAKEVGRRADRHKLWQAGHARRAVPSPEW